MAIRLDFARATAQYRGEGFLKCTVMLFGIFNFFYLFLVDENEDWRFDARLENLDEEFPFPFLIGHLDDLLRSLSGFADGPDVHDRWPTEVRSVGEIAVIML